MIISCNTIVYRRDHVQYLTPGYFLRAVNLNKFFEPFSGSVG